MSPKLKGDINIMNLSKNQTASLIDLSKGATSLPIFKIGASWIKKGKKFMGVFGGGHAKCDLDLCAFAVVNGKIKEAWDCSFERDNSPFMKSSGDDRSGGGNRDTDNEIITIDMNKVPAEVEAVAIIINSYSGEKFDEVDYAAVRVYEGQDNAPTNILCRYEMSSDPSFIGGRTLIIGSIFKTETSWEFRAMGEMRSYQYIRDFKREVMQNS